MDELLPAEEGLAWQGGSVARIRERWADGDSFGPDCGEHKIRPDRDHAVLEALRHSRADVQYLLKVIDRLSGVA